MNPNELREFLDEKVALYNNPKFIESDPIQIPHRFSLRADIEISGFLSATIAWGNRKSIITNASKMMDLMDHAPFDFVLSHGKSIITNASKMMDLMDHAPFDFVLSHEESDLEKLETFVHRTFNGQDFTTFIRALKHIYQNHGGLEKLFSKPLNNGNLQNSIHEFRKVFFEVTHQRRTQKHVSDPLNNSAAKRLNMYLRWMVRRDNKGVDFGLWKTIDPALLSCPLDVHSGNIARKLGLLTRSQNDAKALAELDLALRKLDPADPVKYDFALFGLGAFENF